MVTRLVTTVCQVGKNFLMECSSGPLICSRMEIHPGYETLTTHLTDLITSCPPPFIYIHDPFTPHITASVTNSTVASTSVSATEPSVLFARADPVSCFTPRLLYDSILNKLAHWKPTWEDGCKLWGVSTGRRWNDSIDAFVHGLRAICSELSKQQFVSMADGGKGKGKAGSEQPRIVIIIERAERLKTAHPDLIVPFTRLAELVSP
jgi:origin recognition complex subunit 5